MSISKRSMIFGVSGLAIVCWALVLRTYAFLPTNHLMYRILYWEAALFVAGAITAHFWIDATQVLIAIGSVLAATSAGTMTYELFHLHEVSRYPVHLVICLITFVLASASYFAIPKRDKVQEGAN